LLDTKVRFQVTTAVTECTANTEPVVSLCMLIMLTLQQPAFLV